jgi:hypothetical protein
MLSLRANNFKARSQRRMNTVFAFAVIPFLVGDAALAETPATRASTGCGFF